MTTTDCSQWQGIMALRVAGQAEEGEVLSLEGHLEVCAACRTDARALDEVAEALSRVDVDTVRAGASSTPTRRIAALGPRGHQNSVRVRWAAVIGAGVAATAAVLVAVTVPASNPADPTRSARTVALTGGPGVEATMVLVPQGGGTRATLHVVDEPPGQILTVSMRSRAGTWWVAGSYRSGLRQGALEVDLSCAVAPGRIDEVWVTDQQGRVVLNGYLS